MLGIILSLFMSVANADAAACKDGNLVPRAGEKIIIKQFVQFEEGKVYKYCFKLPAVVIPPPKPGVPGKSPFVTLNVINLGNASCSDLHATMIRPNKPDAYGKNSRVKAQSNGPSPVTNLIYTGGRWELKFKQEWGDCNKYKFTVNWSL